MTSADAADVPSLTVASRSTPVGRVWVACGPSGVVDVSLGDDADALRAALADRWPDHELVDGGRSADAAAEAVASHVWRPRAASPVALDLQGTDFQRRVWDALQAIPVGETRTYTELAEALGMPTGARAVASACAANRLAVVVPCHRVVREDGDLAGYRWGLPLKRALLRREGAPLAAQGLLFGGV